MSMALPCVTTSLANKPLKAKPGLDLLVGESAAEMADHLINLLSDSEFADQIATAGHDFVHRKFSWEMANEKLENAMRQLIR